MKENNVEPDEFEKTISGALLDLEINSDPKAQLRDAIIGQEEGGEGVPARSEEASADTIR